MLSHLSLYYHTTVSWRRLFTLFNYWLNWTVTLQCLIGWWCWLYQRALLWFATCCCCAFVMIWIGEAVFSDDGNLNVWKMAFARTWRGSGYSNWVTRMLWRNHKLLANLLHLQLLSRFRSCRFRRTWSNCSNCIMVNYSTSQCLHDSLGSKHLPLFFCLARLPSTHTKHSKPSSTIMAVEPLVRNTLDPNKKWT